MGGLVPFTAVPIRILAGSVTGIIVGGAVAWLFGAALLTYLIRKIEPKEKLLQRIFLWTVAPFVPVYVVCALLTGSFLKH